ncbi:MAG: Rod shape-determining protein RodA [Pelotomaculum sp. PtaB.Bin013]|nr:MAG: Rod shape-determining protein RodA [Pelotomaculum sp. PtaB.Bin013]
MGKQLHQAHKPRTEWSLLALVGSFIGFGLLSMYTIEKGGLLKSVSGYTNNLLFSDYTSVSVFTNSLVLFLLGVMIAAGMYFFDYRKIKSCSLYLYLGTLLVWLTVFFFGPELNGRQMLNLFWIRIDFVMVTPFLLTIALAGIFSEWNWNQEKGSLKVFFLLATGRRKCKFNYRAGSLLKAFVLLIIPCLFYINSAVMAGAILYTIVFLILMRVSGAKLSRVFLVSMPIISYILFFFLGHPYRLDRITVFMHPYRDPDGAGYLYTRLTETIHAAGLWGQGFTLPAGTLPEVHADSIFAYVVYTFGWITGLAVLTLAVTLIIRMNHVARQAKDLYGRLLVTGLAGIFAVQFFWNILMTLGLAPAFGFSLPFISYTGSQLIIQMAAVGLVLSVYRRKDMVGILK